MQNGRPHSSCKDTASLLDRIAACGAIDAVYPVVLSFGQ
ncbi:hypothetical protein RTCIAT899_CH17710 [Rhizobium tropici CIAT 899]|nr:hypothetical protein RTCIAT899_CH17710 [Rhizobium tropici CIAT 899]